MVEVSDIINTYNTEMAGRSHPNRPSPIALFIMMEGTSITKKLKPKEGKRLTLQERRIALKSAWNSLDFVEKSKYNEAATRLGFVSRIPVTTVETSSNNLISRLKALRLARAAAKNK